MECRADIEYEHRLHIHKGWGLILAIGNCTFGEYQRDVELDDPTQTATSSQEGESHPTSYDPQRREDARSLESVLECIPHSCFRKYFWIL